MTTGRAPAASIIIPHFNGREHLAVCLGALRRQTITDFEVLLVDNGSTDGSQATVRADFPDVRLIELGRNTGFTGACNAGRQAARGEIIILLNNDTEVAPDWLAQINDAFARHDEVGIVASKMLLFDRRDHFHAAGDTVGLDGIPANRGVWQQDTGQYEREEYVFSACGGAAAYRRALLDDIGFLDDDFFFSCEDVDMGWRANLAGWRVLYVPQAVVYHKLKATGGGANSSYYDGRNFLYLLWKNYPGSLLRRHWRAVLRRPAAHQRRRAARLARGGGAGAAARAAGGTAGAAPFLGQAARRAGRAPSIRRSADGAATPG